MNDWLEGARLRTLPAAAAPVLVGAGAAWDLQAFSWGKSALALLVALALQVGVNFANDYSDGIRGTDENRVGPKRLTASGAVPKRTVLRLALGAFAVSAVAGLALIVWSQTWWFILLGVAAVLAAWFYTGGKRPYGYMGIGLSEAMVFVFFGLVATVGTTWVQAYSAPWWLWVAASGMGMASVALLLVNNIRDIPTDSLVGKKTLCVRIGDRASRALFVVVLVASAICGGVASHWSIGIALGICALPGVIGVVNGAKGAELLRTLRNTGLYALAYGVVVGATLAVL